MSQKESAGLLMFRRRGTDFEVLLGHPGGPYWANKHEGTWTLPKGGIHGGETPLDSAIREFTEETGLDAHGPFIALGSVVQKSGKIVHAWAFEGDCDPTEISSGHTRVEWPPRSGRYIEVPELDEAAFFDPKGARKVMNPAQLAFLDRLAEAVNGLRAKD